MSVLSRFVSFCIVGASTLFIDLVFLNIFFYFGFPFFLARILSLLLALSFNFSVNRTITFGAGKTAFTQQIGPYALVYILSNLINFGSSVLIVALSGENVLMVNLASLIGTAIGIPFSFFGSLAWVFRDK